MPRPVPVFPSNNKGPIKDYFNVSKDYNPGNDYILTRTTKYDNVNLPEIAFFGTNKEDIRSYINGNIYYQWRISKEFGKIINLYSKEAQDKIKKLSEANMNIVKKALKLGDKEGFEDKYIRISKDKSHDIEAFKIIKDLFPEYIGSFTPGKDGNPLKDTLELSHNEIVLWNRINEINNLDPIIGNSSQFNEFDSPEPGPPPGPPSGPPQPKRRNLDKKLFGGSKRRSVKKSKNQKKTKRNNSTKKRRRTKKKKSSKN